MDKKEIVQYNKKAWDREVENGSPWSIPVTHRQIEDARQGNFKIILTPCKPVPRSWFPELKGCRLLCLASGGGQQGPLLAAAGARVTVFDNSPRQLAQDKLVAERENLDIRLVEGDMADLSVFQEGSFDFIVHPVSNCFVPDVRPVWKEAYRVLNPGGTLIAGFMNPIAYSFDEDLYEKGIFQVKHKMPYSDLTSLSEEERLARYKDDTIEFGHSLEDQIGGQLAAGFHLTGFYEDHWEEESISEYMPTFISTRALKPA
jgi:SAM-dependent methyltransferase